MTRPEIDPYWYRPQYERMVCQAAHDAWLNYMRRLSPGQYLYYRPSSGAEWGRLFLVREGEEASQPAGSELALPTPLPRGVDEAEMRRLLFEVCRRLPLLPTDR